MTELHVVALSGGKDSTAMALRLVELYPQPYVFVCTPTGNELPEMYLHWRKLSEMLGTRITPVVSGTLTGLIEQQGALPNWRQRWCTRMLKIEPYAAWLLQQTQEYDRVVSYVGLRADEEEREGGDYADIPGVEMSFPMREWGWNLEDVLTYLNLRDVTIPKRTDCAVCFFQRLGEWYDLWREHPEEWAEGERLEALTDHTFRSPGRDTWPASMQGLREQFESGRVPRNRKDALNELKCRVCRL